MRHFALVQPPHLTATIPEQPIVAAERPPAAGLIAVAAELVAAVADSQTRKLSLPRG